MKKRVLLAAGVAVLIGTGVFASAASLGGLSTGSLGANDKIVESCDRDGVKVDFATAIQTGDAFTSPTVAYETATGGAYWAVDSFTLSDVNTACVGKDMKIAMVNNAGAEVYRFDAPVTAASQTIDPDTQGTIVVPGGGGRLAAEEIDHVAIVISGAAPAVTLVP